MKQWVLATNNAGKIREINELLRDIAVTTLPQQHFNLGEVAETGKTFVENALLKARYAAAATGLPALADDSGLVVTGLQGRPGIYSARYAGEQATQADNTAKLLDEMKALQETERDAYFYCVIVLLRNADDPAPVICHGQWSGRILREPVGTQGFGYDPVFYVEQYHCSAAELSVAVKNEISHRGQALKQLKSTLQWQQTIY